MSIFHSPIVGSFIKEGVHQEKQADAGQWRCSAFIPARRMGSGEVLMSAPVGFVGLGLMGQPMALNLAKAGIPLLVWNRSPDKTAVVAGAGADVATDVAEVFAKSEIIIFMLIDGHVMDDVLERSGRGFADRVSGRTIINMATPSPKYSKDLESDIRAHGGRYVEAPVSGSRKPAEAGQLAAMLAGDPEYVASIRPLLGPMCKDAIGCGPVPNALLMKLAVNLFMINMVTGLAEATHFAERQGLELEKLVAVLGASPMASDVSRVKAEKLLSKDFTAQAAITNVLENNRLIAEAAREANIASPLLDVCHALYQETQAQGFGKADMVAVIRAVEERTAAIVRSPL
jgi:3-hydroxyisobutyrate dehydrogenase